MKPGAGQGSPLRVAPLYRRYCDKHYSLSGAGRLRLDGRFTDFAFKMLVLASARSGPMEYLGATERREPTGRGTSSTRGWRGSGTIGLRRQDDMEVALAVRRRWWWRRPGRGRVRVDSVRDGVLLVPRAVDVFLSSCSDKFCSPTQSQFDVGVVPQLQFIDRVLPRCEQRQVPTVAVSQPGSGVAVH